MTKQHRLDLLNNSISYFREAVSHAQSESEDTDQWKFAVVNLVQAMELAFKERLRRVHPAFIYDSVDKPKHTVSLATALARIRSPHIGNIPLSDGECEKLTGAIDLRNALTHFEFDHPHDQIELRFADIFSFLILFYRVHLGLRPEEFIDEDQHQRVLLLVKTREELLSRAKAHIASLDDVDIWICPECQETTFVREEGQCFFCHHAERLVDCPTCGLDNFEHDLVDTSDLTDWDFDEGRIVVLNDYGLEEYACPNCIGDVRRQVEEMRRSQYDEDIAMENYYRSR